VQPAPEETHQLQRGTVSAKPPQGGAEGCTEQADFEKPRNVKNIDVKNLMLRDKVTFFFFPK